MQLSDLVVGKNELGKAPAVFKLNFMPLWGKTECE